MRKLDLILLFIIFSNAVLAQPVIVKELKQINPITKETYRFPKIAIKNSLNTSEKINNTLRFEVLNTEAETPDSKIFESVWRTVQQSPTIHDLSYTINSIDKSLLSLSITGQGCGAYCEGFVSYFTFNLKTGNKLTLDSLFTEEGIKALTDSLNFSKQNKLKAKITQIEHTLKTKSIRNDQWKYKYYSEMLKLYNECLSNNISTEYVKNLGFVAKGKTLNVFTERCSSHYNMTLDELWTFKYIIRISTWQKHLTQYGKSLIKL